jgi:hypothetical protein
MRSRPRGDSSHLIPVQSKSSVRSVGTPAGSVITLAAMIRRQRHCERSARRSNMRSASVVVPASSDLMNWNPLKAKSRPLSGTKLIRFHPFIIPVWL